MIDSGAVEVNGIFEADIIEEPKLCIISLNTNKILRCRNIPKPFYYPQTVLGLIDVEVNVVSDDCSITYGYILDRINGHVTVYSYSEDTFWQFQSIYFKQTPMDSIFNITTALNNVYTFAPMGNIWSATPDNREGLIFSPRARYNDIFFNF